EQFASAEEQLKQALQENPDLADLKEHLLIDQTPEGMRIQIVDAEGRSMFESGSAEPKPYTKKLLALVSDAIGDLPNN
ncbi:chemotaxis protein MotB, partial [Tritonibacter sp. SIMBA_163]